MMTKPLLSVSLACVLGVVSVLGDAETRGPADGMAAAATTWLGTLDEGLRKAATRPFADNERTNWHFVPKQRPGVSIKSMNADQRRAAHELLRSAMSSHGYLKATTIMELEGILHELESRPGRPADHRDPELYWFLVFGDPAGKGPWAWRVEGHHLSLNFTAVGSDIIAFAPLFFGANPAEVRSTRRAGMRALSAEADLALDFVDSLPDHQRGACRISTRVPADIVLAPGKGHDALGKPFGVTVAELSKELRRKLHRLIQSHARALRDDVRARESARIRKSGMDAVRFAWAGNTSKGKAFYYRVTGPTFVIEFDNVQNGANHIHVVWRDPANDFGADALKQHRQRDHK